ncbi:MAG: ribonuclease E inhibitor RraB [Pseudomonadales bacterium]|nr:ribonuclease E inhibitor RraB [Pseudomonadales bacterium]
MDRDEQVINALLENGSDLSKTHSIDFFFDFTSMEQAAPVAQHLEKQSFTVRMFENEDSTLTIEANRLMVPSLTNMQKVTDWATKLTEKYGGKYDGWGTEVVT